MRSAGRSRTKRRSGTSTSRTSRGFTGSWRPRAENIRETKAVADAVRAINPAILVEGELGYIGSSSEIREGIPEGAAIKPEDLTKPEEAARFVKETGGDLVAPAVGNIHGMMANH